MRTPHDHWPAPDNELMATIRELSQARDEYEDAVNIYIELREKQHLLAREMAIASARLDRASATLDAVREKHSGEGDER